MKQFNSTQTLIANSTKKACSKYHTFFYIGFLTALLSLVSINSFAGENNDINHLFSGNTTASPLTGTESMRTNLYLLNADNTRILADGVYTEYSNLYHDSVNWEDAYKMTNILENLGLSRYGSVLAVERRPIISATDTLFFKLWKTTRRSYQLEFVTSSLDHPGMTGYLQDNYLNTNTELLLSGTTRVNFAVNSDPASADVSRFRVVYKTSFAFAPLPVTFTSLKGYQLNNKISVDWKVENEINLNRYEIEHSANGVDFTTISSVKVAGYNSISKSYSWTDENPLKGNNFYRIKSVDMDGAKKISRIVKVSTANNGAGSITIYPNPVTGGIVNLQFANQAAGVYNVRLMDNNGQLVYTTNITMNGNNGSQTLVTGKKLAGGIYQLQIKTPDNTTQVKRAFVQD